MDHSPSAPLRVLVVARQPLARAGLRGLLAESADVQLVGVATSPEDAAVLARDLRPDVALAAWESGGADALVGLVETLGVGGTPLLVLGDAPPPAELSVVLRAGGRGFLLPDASADDVTAALRAVARGLLVLAPVLARAIPSPSLTGVVDAWSSEAALDQLLTDREREVLQLLALGLPNKTIARRLNVSEHTVKFHVGSILAKLDAGSRTEAVTRAARRGLLAL